MARYTFRLCKSCPQMHEVSAWPSECMPEARKRSALPCPAIRSDGMDATLNHADGKLYDSRSGYEKAVRAAGCEIVGNDQPDERQVSEVPNVAQDVKTALEQLKAGL